MMVFIVQDTIQRIHCEITGGSRGGCGGCVEIMEQINFSVTLNGPQSFPSPFKWSNKCIEVVGGWGERTCSLPVSAFV